MSAFPYLSSKIESIFLFPKWNANNPKWCRPSSYIKNYSNLITELRQVNLKGEKEKHLPKDTFSDLTLDGVKCFLNLSGHKWAYLTGFSIWSFTYSINFLVFHVLNILLWVNIQENKISFLVLFNWPTVVFVANWHNFSFWLHVLLKVNAVNIPKSRFEI